MKDIYKVKYKSNKKNSSWNYENNIVVRFVMS